MGFDLLQNCKNLFSNFCPNLSFTNIVEHAFPKKMKTPENIDRATKSFSPGCSAQTYTNCATEPKL